MEKSLSDTSIVTSAAASTLTPRFAHARSSEAVLEHQQHDDSTASDAPVDPPLPLHQVDNHDTTSEPAMSSARSFVSEISSVALSSLSESDESASIWSRPEHKVAAFVLLLLEEFLLAYQFSKTARALKDELMEQKLGSPGTSAELWCEMHHSCRAVLARSSTSSSSSSTIEKLVEFCISSSSSSLSRKGFALELMHQSHLGSPVSVCASPKKASVTKKGSTGGLMPPAFSLMDAHVQMLRSPVVRPSQRTSKATEPAPNITSSSASSQLLQSSASAPVLSASSLAPSETGTNSSEPPGTPASHAAPIAARKAKKKRTLAPAHQHNNHHNQHQPHQIQHHHPESYYYQTAKPHTNGHFGGTQTNVGVHASFEQRTATPGSYVEPALVLAHEAQLKRDLASVRILERELRHIRLEKIAVEPKKALVKRLGFASMSKAESQLLREKRDPYLNDLVMEKLGFSKRAECALCQFAFLQVNLPHKVSFKCIMDVHASWAYEPPDRESATKYRAPLCYDAVHVCRMCAQIVFTHTSTTASAVTSQSLELETGSCSSTTARKPKHQQLLARDDSFCSDPYALPPLFADDCYEHDAFNRGDDSHDDARSGQLVESGAKAIVYANQSNEISHFMTSKEWEVINPQRSTIREAIESTLRKSSTAGPALVAALSGAVAGQRGSIGFKASR
ncbi:hypothetical protein Gpo141_00008923 [Globisporangium polare]